MFENFLGGKNLPRWYDCFCIATCWRVVIMSDRVGEKFFTAAVNFFTAAVFFRGILWHSVNGHFARDF